ncbi:hypothetical protein [Adlercreutzia murintestinalis]|uniref:hypothetical protein n=1 Tax=Adlercreutzia murintestinalis TaxID=2941325 RepID=UPI00203CF6E1|nr:hypothetical protein [Adlercreutzia murintestinalis]
MADRNEHAHYPKATQSAAGGVVASGAGSGHIYGYGMGGDARLGAHVPHPAPGVGAASVPGQAQGTAGQAGSTNGQPAYPGHAGYATGYGYAPNRAVIQQPGYGHGAFSAGHAQEQGASSAGYTQAQVTQYAQTAQQYVPPATSVPQQLDKKRKKRGPLFWFLIVLAIAALIAAALFVWFFFGSGGKSARQGTAGQLEGKTPDEIQAELDRVVEEGMFNISIASTVQFANGTAPGELRIENVPGNRYLMRVVITENDSGQQLYETDLIEPNFHIQSDTLDVDLDAGTYDCTAMFFAYDPETEDLIGQAAAEMVVIVEG